jgi:hypothetical protein
MSFSSLLNATLVIKRLAPVLSSDAETVGGANTLLTADTAPGALSVAVAAATHVATGRYLRFGDVGETEIAQIATYVSGLTVPLVTPLMLPHDSGDQVREVDGAGTAVLDGMYQPITAPVTITPAGGVDGRIRPLRANEVQLFNQGGAVISTLAVDMWPLAGLTTDCWIECGGKRYDINSMPDAAGAGHHLVLGVTEVA